MKESTKRIFGRVIPKAIPQPSGNERDTSELTRILENRGHQSGPHKPLLMVMSDDRNCREMGIVTHTTYHLQAALGIENTPEILTASGQNCLVTLSKNVLWHLQKYAGHYSAIVTLDPWVTNLVHGVIKDMEHAAPLVFVGLDPTAASALVGAGDKPMGKITGVQTVFPEYHEQMEVLRDLRPTGNRVIVPRASMIARESDMDDVFIQDHSSFAGACSKNDFSINTLPLFPEDDVVENLKQIDTRKGDIVCIPTDSPILSQAERITEYCNEISATAYAFDLTAVARGAAIGSGSSGYTYARRIVPILYQLLVDQRHPSAVNVETVVESSESRYNEMAMRKQGIQPTMRDWRLMKIRSVFTYDEE